MIEIAGTWSFTRLFVFGAQHAIYLLLCDKLENAQQLRVGVCGGAAHDCEYVSVPDLQNRRPSSVSDQAVAQYNASRSHGLAPCAIGPRETLSPAPAAPPSPSPSPSPNTRASALPVLLAVEPVTSPAVVPLSAHAAAVGETANATSAVSVTAAARPARSPAAAAAAANGSHARIAFTFSDIDTATSQTPGAVVTAAGAPTGALAQHAHADLSGDATPVQLSPQPSFKASNCSCNSVTPIPSPVPSPGGHTPVAENAITLQQEQTALCSSGGSSSSGTLEPVDRSRATSISRKNAPRALTNIKQSEFCKSVDISSPPPYSPPSLPQEEHFPILDPAPKSRKFSQQRQEQLEMAERSERTSENFKPDETNAVNGVNVCRANGVGAKLSELVESASVSTDEGVDSEFEGSSVSSRRRPSASQRTRPRTSSRPTLESLNSTNSLISTTSTTSSTSYASYASASSAANNVNGGQCASASAGVQQRICEDEPESPNYLSNYQCVRSEWAQLAAGEGEEEEEEGEQEQTSVRGLRQQMRELLENEETRPSAIGSGHETPFEEVECCALSISRGCAGLPEYVASAGECVRVSVTGSDTSSLGSPAEECARRCLPPALRLEDSLSLISEEASIDEQGLSLESLNRSSAGGGGGGGREGACAIGMGVGIGAGLGPGADSSASVLAAAAADLSAHLSAKPRFHEGRLASDVGMDKRVAEAEESALHRAPGRCAINDLQPQAADGAGGMRSRKNSMKKCNTELQLPNQSPIPSPSPSPAPTNGSTYSYPSTSGRRGATQSSRLAATPQHSDSLGRAGLDAHLNDLNEYPRRESLTGISEHSERSESASPVPNSGTWAPSLPRGAPSPDLKTDNRELRRGSNESTGAGAGAGELEQRGSVSSPRTSKRGDKQGAGGASGGVSSSLGHSIQRSLKSLLSRAAAPLSPRQRRGSPPERPQQK